MVEQENAVNQVVKSCKSAILTERSRLAMSVTRSQRRFSMSLAWHVSKTIEQVDAVHGAPRSGKVVKASGGERVDSAVTRSLDAAGVPRQSLSCVTGLQSAIKFRQASQLSNAYLNRDRLIDYKTRSLRRRGVNKHILAKCVDRECMLVYMYLR